MTIIRPISIVSGLIQSAMMLFSGSGKISPMYKISLLVIMVKYYTCESMALLKTIIQVPWGPVSILINFLAGQ